MKILLLLYLLYLYLFIIVIRISEYKIGIDKRKAFINNFMNLFIMGIRSRLKVFDLWSILNSMHTTKYLKYINLVHKIKPLKIYYNLPILMYPIHNGSI